MLQSGRHGNWAGTDQPYDTTTNYQWWSATQHQRERHTVLPPKLLKTKRMIPRLTASTPMGCLLLLQLVLNSLSPLLAPYHLPHGHTHSTWVSLAPAPALPIIEHRVASVVILGGPAGVTAPLKQSWAVERFLKPHTDKQDVSTAKSILCLHHAWWFAWYAERACTNYTFPINAFFNCFPWCT